MTFRWIGPVMVLALLLKAGCSVQQDETDLQPPEESLDPYTVPEDAARDHAIVAFVRFIDSGPP